MTTGQADLAEYQRRIDAIPWYHEFDFPNGLVARSETPDAGGHRRLWEFTQRELDRIDFAGKTVLDIGCWDGYWSFYAERRGAARVLATDDRTQNWAGSAGLLLAKELLGSSVETRLDVPAYELARLDETFDIVLCLAVYYHLVDPMFAFAQIRHCCHPGSIVVVEGEALCWMPGPMVHYDFTNASKTRFAPTAEGLSHMLELRYLETVSQTELARTKPLNWRRRLRHCSRLARLRRGDGPTRSNRVITVCRPFEGRNRLHCYRPPFGLHRYDDRFRDGPDAPAA